MTRKRTLPGIACVSLFAVLAACDGSVNFDIHTPPVPVHWPPDPVDVYGMIEEPGTITLVGVRYDTSAAEVTANGVPARAEDLAAGQIVHVVGTVHEDRLTGTAERVRSEAALIGPIESVSPQDGVLVALGQTVRTDANTRFGPFLDPTLESGPDAGTRIRVHGWRDAAGDIRASRIDLDVAGREVQVVGIVAAPDLTYEVFTLGGLAVDYGLATGFDVPGWTPEEGRAVVARGVLAGDSLIAREVRSVPMQFVRLPSDLP